MLSPCNFSPGWRLCFLFITYNLLNIVRYAVVQLCIHVSSHCILSLNVCLWSQLPSNAMFAHGVLYCDVWLRRACDKVIKTLPFSRRLLFHLRLLKRKSARWRKSSRISISQRRIMLVRLFCSLLNNAFELNFGYAEIAHQPQFRTRGNWICWNILTPPMSSILQL